MKNANQDIRDAISKSGFLYWRIADRYGLTDGNFSRLLRKELTPEQKDRILSIIEELKAEEEHNGN